MNNLTTIITLLISSSLFLRAQNLSLGGYYENQFFPQKLKGTLYLFDYNKLRVDLESDIGESVRFNADFICQTYHGNTRFQAFDYLPDHVVSDYAGQLNIPVQTLSPFFTLDYRDRNFLDNAFAAIRFGLVDIHIGKQQLPWGTGYTWNPSDVFNEKNVLDPTYEKIGVNAFKLDLAYASHGTITAVLTINKKWRNSGKAIRIKNFLLGFDLSASYLEKEQESFDYYRIHDLSSLPVDTLLQNLADNYEDLFIKTEKRNLFALDFAGELLGLGVWGEGAYNWMQKSPDFGQYLVGIDYTFENSFYIIAEYYRNELGKKNKDEYSFNDWMRLLGEQGENLGMDYLFSGTRYPLTDLLSGSAFGLVNLSDKSSILFPWLDYSLSNNAVLSAVGYIPLGTAASEFGDFGSGGFLRLRVYF